MLSVVYRLTPGAIVALTIEEFFQGTIAVPEPSRIWYCTLNLAAEVDELVFVTLYDDAL